MAIDLNTELTRLRRAILSMGASVEQRVAQAIEALFDHDTERAFEVRHGDDEIDGMEMAIEEECLKVLALTQPVARDLRLVLAVLRINTELERIGDLARNVAKRTLELEKLTPVEFPESLVEMAKYTQIMVSNAMGALAEGETALAWRIRNEDKRLDNLQRDIIAWVQEEIPRRVEFTAAAIDMLSIARNFERIGDHTTNIAEDVIFLIEGELVRHAPVEPS